MAAADGQLRSNLRWFGPRFQHQVLGKRCCLDRIRSLLFVDAPMTSPSFPLDEKTSSEKLWLLAGELLRDEGIEDVNAQHLAALMGQALTCVAVYSAIDPLDSRTIHHVISHAEAAALDAHEHFTDQVQNLQSR